jgi:hypothetical protein
MLLNLNTHMGSRSRRTPGIAAIGLWRERLQGKICFYHRVASGLRIKQRLRISRVHNFDAAVPEASLRNESLLHDRAE